MNEVRIFGDEDKAEQWLKSRIWRENNGEPICPKCGSIRISTTPSRKYQPYRCMDCLSNFSFKTGSILSQTKLPYSTWAMAIFLASTNLKGVASMKMYRDFAIRQKSAWHLSHRIRKVWEYDSNIIFQGPVEVDEVFPDGIVKNYNNKRRAIRLEDLRIQGKSPHGRNGDDTLVVGMYDRATKTTIAKVMPKCESSIEMGKELRKWVLKHTAENAVVITDGEMEYRPLAWNGRRHYFVKHTENKYVTEEMIDGKVVDITTNGIESFWAMVRRAYKGVFHKMSIKHMQRYFDEAAGRRNIREMDTLEIMDWIADRMFGRRLTYKELTKDNGLPSYANTGKELKQQAEASKMSLDEWLDDEIPW